MRSNGWSLIRLICEYDTSSSSLAEPPALPDSASSLSGAMTSLSSDLRLAELDLPSDLTDKSIGFSCNGDSEVRRSAGGVGTNSLSDITSSCGVGCDDLCCFRISSKKKRFDESALWSSIRTSLLFSAACLNAAWSSRCREYIGWKPGGNSKGWLVANGLKGGGGKNGECGK